MAKKVPLAPVATTFEVMADHQHPSAFGGTPLGEFFTDINEVKAFREALKGLCDCEKPAEPAKPAPKGGGKGDAPGPDEGAGAKLPAAAAEPKVESLTTEVQGLKDEVIKLIAAVEKLPAKKKKKSE